VGGLCSELIWRLQENPSLVTGLDAVAPPAAGSSVLRLTVPLLVRAPTRRARRGEQLLKVLIPDRRRRLPLPSDGRLRADPVQTYSRGNIDVDELRVRLDEHTAAPHAQKPVHARLFD